MLEKTLSNILNKKLNVSHLPRTNQLPDVNQNRTNLPTNKANYLHISLSQNNYTSLFGKQNIVNFFNRKNLVLNYPTYLSKRRFSQDYSESNNSNDEKGSNGRSREYYEKEQSRNREEGKKIFIKGSDDFVEAFSKMTGFLRGEIDGILGTFRHDIKESSEKSRKKFGEELREFEKSIKDDLKKITDESEKKGNILRSNLEREMEEVKKTCGLMIKIAKDDSEKLVSSFIESTEVKLRENRANIDSKTEVLRSEIKDTVKQHDLNLGEIQKEYKKLDSEIKDSLSRTENKYEIRIEKLENEQHSKIKSFKRLFNYKLALLSAVFLTIIAYEFFEIHPKNIKKFFEDNNILGKDNFLMKHLELKTDMLDSIEAVKQLGKLMKTRDKIQEARQKYGGYWFAYWREDGAKLQKEIFMLQEKERRCQKKIHKLIGNSPISTEGTDNQIVGELISEEKNGDKSENTTSYRPM